LILIVSSLLKQVPDLQMHIQKALSHICSKGFGQRLGSVRIRARIGHPHPLVCLKRQLNGAVLRMRLEKPRPRFTVRVAR
jgi:hypothetical protein